MRLLRNRTTLIKSRDRIRGRIFGLIMLGMGMLALGILYLISAPMVLLLLPGALIFIGILLLASPEVYAIVIESLSWIT